MKFYRFFSGLSYETYEKALYFVKKMTVFRYNRILGMWYLPCGGEKRADRTTRMTGKGAPQAQKNAAGTDGSVKSDGDFFG